MNPFLVVWQIHIGMVYDRHIRHWARHENADPAKWPNHETMIADMWGPLARIPPYYLYIYPQLRGVARTW